MELKNIFQMTKTDRYTQDGRDELAKLQETEDVTYKTGDISQKTGLQKQPDGSWAPPKKASAPNKTEGKKIDYQVTEKGGKFYATGHQFSDGSQLHAGPFGSEKEVHEFMNNTPYKPAESKPAENKPALTQTEFVKQKMEQYKDLSPEQKKDAMYAASYEGITIGGTQNGMERAGWDLIQADDDVNVYAKPDGSKVTMKHDGQKITSSEYEAPAENPDYPFKPKTSEERAERAKFEKDRDDFIERMNAYREESNQWTKRAKGERTATLVDWLDDWDKHPEEKNDAAYAAIEKELASRGVNRAGRQNAKEADNAGRNEFYRRAYESDAAPRILTGDTKIRIKK